MMFAMRLLLVFIIVLLNWNMTEQLFCFRCHFPPPWSPSPTKRPTTTRPTTTTTPCPTFTQPKWTPPTRPTWTRPTTIATTRTTTSNEMTTIPSFPGVIIPHKDDQPPKFTATIAATNEEPICSATIISLYFVLSSCKQCLQKGGRPIPSGNALVLVGDLQPDEISGLAIVSYEVKHVVLHPECFYNGKYNAKHDIGIIQTFDEIEFGPFVEAAKIPPKTNYVPDLNRNWNLAAFKSRHTIATTLKEAVWFVKVRTVKPEICRLILNSSYYDETRNYCTPYEHSGGKDSCSDDFGLSLSMDNRLIGLLIHKFGCGKSDAAGSFVSVAYNSEWIRKTVRKLSEGKESV